jgi:outer membrane murein-binding lipoprotein Lpp
MHGLMREGRRKPVLYSTHIFGGLEAAKVEAAKNTIANLTGKLEAMQAQIERQAGELDAARQGAEKAGGDAAELGDKPAAKPPKAPSKG